MKSRLVNEELMWKLTAWAAAVTAAWVVRQVMEKAWEQTRGEAPKNPDDPNTSWGEVAAWAALTGVGAALARAMGRKGAASVWARATGDAPPSV